MFYSFQSYNLAHSRVLGINRRAKTLVYPKLHLFDHSETYLIKLALIKKHFVFHFTVIVTINSVWSFYIYKQILLVNYVNFQLRVGLLLVSSITL